jgi:hypothetical protein
MRARIAYRPCISVFKRLLAGAPPLVALGIAAGVLLASPPVRAQDAPPEPPPSPPPAPPSAEEPAAPPAPPVDPALLRWMEQRIAAEVEARMAAAQKKQAPAEEKPQEKALRHV